ncbi:hypothetical protein KBY25_19130 [Ruegeria pomeroyi]|nr:hypothetical protein [Ruegeria pomeroyi]
MTAFAKLKKAEEDVKMEKFPSDATTKLIIRLRVSDFGAQVEWCRSQWPPR